MIRRRRGNFMPCVSPGRPVDVTARAFVSQRPAHAVWQASSARYDTYIDIDFILEHTAQYKC